MADLRRFALDLGFTEPRTLLQSGNLVMDGGDGGEDLEQRLQAEAVSRLGVTVDFVTRTSQAWRAVIEANPFGEAAETDPGHLLVFFLKAPPATGAIDDLRAAITGREVVHLHGAQAYLVYPDGIGDSRLTNTVIERRLGVRGTGRNWNTVQKIAALAEA
jgi:uncharacterized protein (DUF1697 family)